MEPNLRLPLCLRCRILGHIHLNRVDFLHGVRNEACFSGLGWDGNRPNEIDPADILYYALFGQQVPRQLEGLDDNRLRSGHKLRSKEYDELVLIYRLMLQTRG